MALIGDLRAYPHFPGFDPLTPGQLEDPFAELAQARAEQPVFYMEKYGMWVVTRHEDVWAAYKDQASFSNAVAHQPRCPRPQSILDRKGDWALPVDGNLNTIDQPTHMPLKRVWKTALDRAVDGIGPWLDRRIEELVSAFEDRGEADLVEVLTWPLTVSTVAHLIGAADEDAEKFKCWAEGWFELTGSSALSPEHAEACWHGFVDFEEYIERLIADRRREPRDDFASFLIAEQVKGAPISDREIVTNTIGVVAAGSDTTANAIGQMMHLLLSSPDRLQDVHALPELRANVIEETLRLRGPVRCEIRTTARDVTLSGVTIPQGAMVCLHLGSASRDESLFDRADEFDPRRERLSRHMAFGALSRVCIGAPLARLEMRKTLDVVIDRFPRLRLADDQAPLRYTESLVVPSLRSLKVKW
jgi:cytochrome P450